MIYWILGGIIWLWFGLRAKQIAKQAYTDCYVELRKEIDLESADRWVYNALSIFVIGGPFSYLTMWPTISYWNWRKKYWDEQAARLRKMREDLKRRIVNIKRSGGKL